MNDSRQAWSNWSDSVACRPSGWLLPESEDDVIAAIGGVKDGGHIRVAGSGHSFTPLCASDDLLLSLERMSGIESIDASGRAWIRAGSKIHDIGGLLAEAGWALANQGDVDVQAIAGAISTGTHGTGPKLGSLSTQLCGLRIVTAAGEIVELSPERDRDLFRAGQVALGTLGVVTAVRLQTLPRYRLHEQVRREQLRDCLDRLDRRIAANRHFEFFWYPADDCAFTKTLNPTDRLATPLTDPETAASGAGLSSESRERVADSWQIFPTVRNNKFNEMEYSLPAERGVDCFLAIRDLMLQSHPEAQWPVEYRTQAADDIPISAAEGRATVAISIHQGANLPHESFFHDAEVIFRRHAGRPHWAKMHSLSARDLRELYPHWDKFQTARKQLDPDNRMLNPYLQRLFLDQTS